MGTGKTLSLVYLALLNKFKHGKIIYSNMDLGFGHFRVQQIEQFDMMNGGESGAFFCGDENNFLN